MQRTLLHCIYQRNQREQEEYESAIRRETKLFILKGNLGEGLCINLLFLWALNHYALQPYILLVFFSFSKASKNISHNILTKDCYFFLNLQRIFQNGMHQFIHILEIWNTCPNYAVTQLIRNLMVCYVHSIFLVGQSWTPKQQLYFDQKDAEIFVKLIISWRKQLWCDYSTCTIYLHMNKFNTWK